MRNEKFCLSGVPQWLLQRTNSLWITVAIRKGVRNISFCALPTSICRYLRSWRPTEYQLVTVPMSLSLDRTTLKPYDTSVGIGLNLNLYEISLLSRRAATWQRQLLPARAVALACLSSAHRNGKMCSAVLRYCSTWQMHLLFRTWSSCNFGLRTRSLQSVFSRRFTLFYRPSQMRRPLVRKEFGLFERLKSMPVLPLWTSAALMKASSGTRQ